MNTELLSPEQPHDLLTPENKKAINHERDALTDQAVCCVLSLTIQERAELLNYLKGR